MISKIIFTLFTIFSGISGLHVTDPRDGDVAIAGEEYTVKWTGEESSVDSSSIDLYHHHGLDVCGMFIKNLYPSCRISDGKHDIKIPKDVEPGYYSIRVGNSEHDSTFDCSDLFLIVKELDDADTFSYAF